MPKRRRSRIYLRGGRYWGDFRDFAAQGGRREPLIPDGDSLATPDATIATELAAERLKDLQERKRNKVLLGVERTSALGDFASYHLERKAEGTDVTDRWLSEMEKRLERALDFFGRERDLASVGTRDVQAWLTHLQKTKQKGRTLSAATLRHHLNALSNLYRRAVSEGYCVLNPALALMDKPRPAAHESAWLEIHEAALYLEAARTWKVPTDSGAHPATYEIVATFLLTGGRESEVLGLEVEDVSFDRGTVTFRPHDHRRLKTRTSHRTVPLWPQLREILQRYIFEKGGPTSGLLFPSQRPARKHTEEKGPRMITDLRKSLDSIAERAGWKEGEIRTRRFRTTYATTRLQTLDRGAPVAVWTVAREMGHSSTAMLERVYGKLGTVRHRSEVVEYRVEQHRAKLAERLEALR